MNHLIFLFVDHFEPDGPDPIREWTRQYPPLAGLYTDADGRHPRHTWFVEGNDPAVPAELAPLVRGGFGEIEFHLHHSHDDAASLRRLIEARKQVFHNAGALITATGQDTYGLIHGKWSLDNSRGPNCCGVNNELQVLRDTGCYADFTFPAWGRMNPRKRNSIYYAQDDPTRPKSYDDGVEVQVGRDPCGDLMLLQGPGNRSGIPEPIGRIAPLRALLEKCFLTCSITYTSLPTPSRTDRWVRAHVHVAGRPEWTFVKVHTHGARPRNFPAYFGKPAEAMFAHLEARYNDGRAWQLHYATAREAYNMVKAAEAGKEGNPSDYRDFLMTPYRNAT